MALSPEAKQAKREATRQSWLNKAIDYGIEVEGREAEAIKEARKIYYEDYWERRAQESAAKLVEAIDQHSSR